MKRALPLLLGVALGCPSARDVVYELPVGYRGVFVVAVDDDAANLPYSNGAYYVRVPASGVLLVRDAAPLERWHGARATFADGTSIDVARGQAHEPYDAATTVLYYLATTPGPRHHYFVGTEADLAALPEGNVAGLPLGKALPPDP